MNLQGEMNKPITNLKPRMVTSSFSFWSHNKWHSLTRWTRRTRYLVYVLYCSGATNELT